jgi:hypothetical protein
LHLSHGVLLLDPTIKEGTPLWYGYCNWEATPGINADTTLVGPPRDSLSNDLIYWAKKPDAFRTSLLNDPALTTYVPVQALLHLVSAEWLIMADYIRTRLGQIEWEFCFPEHFLQEDNNLDFALKKLFIWRRLVPLYIEMLTTTLRQKSQFMCYTANLISSGSGLGNMKMSDASDITSTDRHNNCQYPLHPPASAKQRSIIAFHDDFAQALSYMEEYRQRVDSLTSGLASLVTALTSMRDSRRAMEDNKNVTRLTWLAALFIPLSFVASLFSMQDDISKLQESFKLYFKVAFPLTAIGLGLVFALTLLSASKVGRRIKNALTFKI